MSDHDERLAALLADAVSDVEPTDALDAIRARTRVAPHPRRPWFLAAGGAVVATAAVITAIALATRPATPPSTTPGPATQAPTAASDSPSPPETSSPAGSGGTPIPVYYVGDTSHGPRLYRYFEPQSRADTEVGVPAELALLTAQPSDPDYRTLWPVGAFATLSDPEAGMVVVTLADASLHDRPAGMTEAEAALAIQQVIYTVQARFQERLAVQFHLQGDGFDSNPIDQVLGVGTSEPLTNAPQLDVLSHVSLSDPAEGTEVSGSFTARGVASSFEANVHWQLLDGEKVVRENAFTAEGYDPDRLYPFTGTVDLTGVPPGTYTFLVETDDPSGGAEGNGPDVDTRTVVVR